MFFNHDSSQNGQQLENTLDMLVKWLKQEYYLLNGIK